MFHISPDNRRANPILKRKIRTAQDAALALYQLIDEVFPAKFDMAAVMAHAALILDQGEAPTTRFVSEAVTDQDIEDKQLLELYNTLVSTLLVVETPLAHTAPNIEFVRAALTRIRDNVHQACQPESKTEAADHAYDPDAVDAALQAIISQPELAIKKTDASEGTLENSITKILAENLRLIKTPLEQYNGLVATLLDSTTHPPLTDTASNATLAITLFEEARQNLQHYTPPITPADIDATILRVLYGVKTHLSHDKIHAITEYLQEHLSESLHLPLEMYNSLQRYFLYEPLDNTVENNQLAMDSFTALSKSVADVIGEKDAPEVLGNIIETLPQDENRLTEQEKVALDLLREHFSAANQARRQAVDQPISYTREVVKIATQDSDVLPHEKVALLQEISQMMTARQKETTAAGRNAHINTMATYFDSLGVSTEELGKNIIKRIYALKLGEEEPELKESNTNAEQSIAEEETTPTMTPTVTQTTPVITEEDEDIAAERKHYERPAKLKTQPAASRINTGTDTDAENENRPESPLTPQREKGERIYLSIVDDIREAKEKNAAARQAAEAKRLAAEKEKIKPMATEEHDLETEHLSFAQHLQQANMMPAGYLQQQPRIIDKDSSLAGIFDEEEDKTAAVADEKSTRTSVNAPNFPVTSNAAAMRERMYEYGMQYYDAPDARKTAANLLQDKIKAAYQAKIGALMTLIQTACTVAGKPVMMEMNTKLTELFTQSPQSYSRAKLSDLEPLQATIIKQVLAISVTGEDKTTRALGKDKTILALITHLNSGSKTETNLMQAIAAFSAQITRHGKPAEKTLATVLLAKCEAFNKLKSFDKNKFARRLKRATDLQALVYKDPTPTEKAARTFLPQLAILYADIENTDSELKKTRASLAALTANSTATPVEIATANATLKEAESQANAAEKNLIDAFKTFIRSMTVIADAQPKLVQNREESKSSEPILPLTPEQISQRTDEFVQRFLGNINSSRLQRMKHIAMVVLDNIEQLHITAFNKHHPTKALFSEYREKIWGISPSLSVATENERVLTETLTEFLQKTGHDIAVKIDADGLIHVEPSPGEDQRLRLLTSISHYHHSLDVLKKSLPTQQADELTPVMEATDVCMKQILGLNIKENADRQKLPTLQKDIENAAVGWGQSVSRIVEASKKAAPVVASAATTKVRAAGNLGMLEEARLRATRVAERQKVLAGIFKSAPKQNP